MYASAEQTVVPSIADSHSVLYTDYSAGAKLLNKEYDDAARTVDSNRS